MDFKIYRTAQNDYLIGARVEEPCGMVVWQNGQFRFSQYAHAPEECEPLGALDYLWAKQNTAFLRGIFTRLLFRYALYADARARAEQLLDDYVDEDAQESRAALEPLRQRYEDAQHELLCRLAADSGKGFCREQLTAE